MNVIIAYEDGGKNDLGISCDFDDKIKNLKEKIHIKLNILSGCILLKYDGVLLDDDKCVNECGIKTDDKIVMLV